MTFLNPEGFTVLWSYFFPQISLHSVYLVFKYLIAWFCCGGLGCFFIDLFLPPLRLGGGVSFLPTQTRVIWEKGTSTAKMPLPDTPVDKSMDTCSLNDCCGRDQSPVDGAIPGQWSCVVLEKHQEQASKQHLPCLGPCLLFPAWAPALAFLDDER